MKKVWAYPTWVRWFMVVALTMLAIGIVGAIPNLLAGVPLVVVLVVFGVATYVFIVLPAQRAERAKQNAKRVKNNLPV